LCARLFGVEEDEEIGEEESKTNLKKSLIEK
jgi:hypothetical protein